MLVELEPHTQHYAWGEKDHGTAVARLAAGNGSSLEAKPYAEWWMGSHKSGMTRVKNGEPLDAFLAANPQFAEADCDTDFPFLLKVLSCGQPLSLQSHPAKVDAERLHREQPSEYKDANHKPEMTIAISDEFEALCGFYPRDRVIGHAQLCPALRRLVAGGESLSDSDFLRQCFSRLLALKSTDEGAKFLAELSREANGDSAVERLFRRVLGFYPDDATAAAVFLLQYHTLRKGEAIFVGPNLIHAYLKGDCVECMACSDNVIRGGLTPKYIDKENLLALLRFEPGGHTPVAPDILSTGHAVFRAPVSEFEVHRMQGNVAYSLPSGSPMILFCLEGSGSLSSDAGGAVALKTGSVVLAAAGSRIELKGDAVVWGAHAGKV